MIYILLLLSLAVFLLSLKESAAGIFLTTERSNVPGNVVAPAYGLNPVNSSSVDPHQVSRPLDEAVHRDVGLVEVLQHRPPGPCQVVHPMSEQVKGKHVRY